VIKYLRQTTIGAAGNNDRGAAGNGLAPRSSTWDKQRAASRENGLGATIKYLRRITSSAACYGPGTTINCLSSAEGIDSGTMIK
jgi:hypothetical protein